MGKMTYMPNYGGGLVEVGSVGDRGVSILCGSEREGDGYVP